MLYKEVQQKETNLNTIQNFCFLINFTPLDNPRQLYYFLSQHKGFINISFIYLIMGNKQQDKDEDEDEDQDEESVLDNQDDEQNIVQQQANPLVFEEGDYLTENAFFNDELYQVTGLVLQEIIHRSIGAIICQDKSGKLKVGSGFLISNNLVLTTANNIFNKEQKSEYSQFRFYLGAQGSTEQYHQFEKWKYSKTFEDCDDASELQFNFALVKLKNNPSLPISLSQFPTIALPCVECLKEKAKSALLQVFGFPTAQNSAEEEGKKVIYQYGVCSRDKIIEVNYQKQWITYQMEPRDGFAGCPVIIDGKVMGIHVGKGKRDKSKGRLTSYDLISYINFWGKMLDKYSFKSISDNIDCQSPKHTTKLQKYDQMVKTIDVSKYTNLTKLNLSYNQITTIDLSKNINLTKLNISKNQLTGIDLSFNSKLILLNIESNNLQAINLVHNTNLQTLQLNQNSIVFINLTQSINLRTLNLNGNKISVIDLSKNLALSCLFIEKNAIQYINLTSNINLQELNLSSNVLKSINLRANVNLKRIKLAQNQIAEIDLSKNIQLQNLDISNNKLASISLTRNFLLQTLQINNNLLQSINLSNNADLISLNIQKNLLKNINLIKNNRLFSIKLDQNHLESVNLLQYSSHLFTIAKQKSKQCKVFIVCDEKQKDEGERIAQTLLGKYTSNASCKYSFTVKQK